MRALMSDPSPEAQLRAVVMYHFYVEGIGAEASYPLYFAIFEKTGMFPAMAEGIQLIRRDEARHIAFGTYLLQRLLEEHPHLEAVFESEMAVIESYIELAGEETFAPFAGRPTPFGLDPDDYRGLYRENYELQRRNVFSRELPKAV